MAGPDPRGSVFKTRSGGFGIRWVEAGKRPQRTGFTTKTAAREWFRENIASRLHDGAPDQAISYDAFCELYLERWGPTVARRTRETDRRAARPRRASSTATRRCARARAPPATPPGGAQAHRHIALPAHARWCARRSTPRCAGATSGQPGRRERPEPGAAQRGVRPLQPRRNRRARRRARRDLRAARRLRRGDLGSARTSGPRSSAATSTRPAERSRCSAATPTAS